MCAANIDQFQRKQEEAQPQPHGPGKPTVRRHGSGRRHTLQNGVDQNMVRYPVKTKQKPVSGVQNLKKNQSVVWYNLWLEAAACTSVNGL